MSRVLGKQTKNIQINKIIKEIKAINKHYKIRIVLPKKLEFSRYFSETLRGILKSKLVDLFVIDLGQNFNRKVFNQNIRILSDIIKYNRYLDNYFREKLRQMNSHTLINSKSNKKKIYNKIKN